MAFIEFERLDAEAVALVRLNLPSSMHQVELLIGLELTLVFMGTFGGQMMVIPKHQHGMAAATFDKIGCAIGLEATLLLCGSFGGEKFMVPRGIEIKLALRNRAIIRDFDEALKTMSATLAANSLATKYGLTYRQIEMIANGKTGNPKAGKKPAPGEAYLSLVDKPAPAPAPEVAATPEVAPSQAIFKSIWR